MHFLERDNSVFCCFRPRHCSWCRSIMQQWGYHPDIDCHYGFLQWHDLPQRSLQELHLYDGIHSTRGKYYHATHGAGDSSPDCVSRWLSGCHVSVVVTPPLQSQLISIEMQCNNVRDTVTNNTPGRIILLYDITIQGVIKYTLPLRSCNTMSTDVLEGVEYFNTVVVQPHRKLVTNQGRGYHVRCRYQTEEKLLQNDFNVR